jgi:hypothetical protein
MSQKSSALSVLLNKEKTLAVLATLILLPKKPQPLVNLKKDKKRNGREESPCPPAHNADR